MYQQQPNNPHGQHGFPVSPAGAPQQPAPPPTGRKAWLIIGILAAVLLLGTVGTLFATGVFSPDEGNVADADDDGSNDSASDEPDVDEPSENPDDTQYQFLDGMCDQLDLSDYEDIMPVNDDLPMEDESVTDDELYGDKADCLVYFAKGEKLGYLEVEATFAPSVLEARMVEYFDYYDLKIGEDDDDVAVQEGEWEYGEILETAKDDQTTMLLVQSDNIVIFAEAWGDFKEQAAVSAALIATAEQIMELTAAT